MCSLLTQRKQSSFYHTIQQHEQETVFKLANCTKLTQDIVVTWLRNVVQYQLLTKHNVIHNSHTEKKPNLHLRDIFTIFKICRVLTWQRPYVLKFNSKLCLRPSGCQSTFTFIEKHRMYGKRRLGRSYNTTPPPPPVNHCYIPIWIFYMIEDFKMISS